MEKIKIQIEKEIIYCHQCPYFVRAYIGDEFCPECNITLKSIKPTITQGLHEYFVPNWCPIKKNSKNHAKQAVSLPKESEESP